MQTIAIHELPTSQVFAALDSNPQGLTPDEARERLAQYGLNVLHERS